MKTRRILFPITLSLTAAAIIILSAFNVNGHKGFHNLGGIANSYGSPGEPGTCSRPTCHGAGATPAGIADNAGPGTMILSAVPALTGNQYVGGTTYAMSVTLSQANKLRFGFGCEIIDNTGNTNTYVNNSAGKLVVTDPTDTRITQVFAAGRQCICHDTLGGYPTKGSHSYTYTFNWMAPAKGFGTVNVYLCGNAVNDDNLADSGDYVYSQHIVLTENTTTSIAGLNEGSLKLDVYPSPSDGRLTVSFTLPDAANASVSLYSMSGQLVRNFENTQMNAGEFSKTYNVNDLAKGMYFMKVNAGDFSETHKVIIE